MNRRSVFVEWTVSRLRDNDPSRSIWPPALRRHISAVSSGAPTVLDGRDGVGRRHRTLRRWRRRRVGSYPGPGQMSLGVHPARCLLVSRYSSSPAANSTGRKDRAPLERQSINHSIGFYYVPGQHYAIRIGVCRPQQRSDETVRLGRNYSK